MRDSTPSTEAEMVATAGVPNDGSWPPADRRATTSPFEMPTPADMAPDVPLVLLEDQVRLTVYSLRPDAAPAELSVLLGWSPTLPGWSLH